MTRNPDNELPTPTPNEPVPAWPEYRQLKEATHDYLDHEPDNPAWADIWRAFAVIMGEYQRDAFAQAFDVDEPAEQACIRRLITGEDESHTHRWKPMTTQLGRPTARQQTTIRHFGSTTRAASQQSTRCISIPATSSGWIHESHHTTSGSISSSSLRSGVLRTRSFRNRGIISARPFRLSSIPQSGTADFLEQSLGESSVTATRRY
jgi:hypothetical protein